MCFNQLFGDVNIFCIVLSTKDNVFNVSLFLFVWNSLRRVVLPYLLGGASTDSPTDVQHMGSCSSKWTGWSTAVPPYGLSRFARGQLSGGNTSGSIKYPHIQQRPSFLISTLFNSLILVLCLADEISLLPSPLEPQPAWPQQSGLFQVGLNPADPSSVTDWLLSLPQFWAVKILWGFNKHRWVGGLTAIWNIPILYKHYITIPISCNWQLSIRY